MNAQILPSKPSSEQSSPLPSALGLKSRVHSFLFGDPLFKPQIGHFTIERSLGRGGMGNVFLAHDSALDRAVALKIVRSDRVSSHAQERLKREARALAKLSHPNVVPVFEVGEHEGSIYVAMEYIIGQNLRQWLDQSPRSWESILGVFKQAGEGLAAAHQAGLVHRDFKPENVVVGSDGRVRVVDFGLVASDDNLPLSREELPHRSDPASLDLVDPPLTQTGDLLGTPAYMAPEQFSGESPSPASDQFSFFAALFEALENTRAFTGHSLPELRRSVLTQNARPMSSGKLPKNLRESIARGLAREPADRFDDMGRALASLSPPPSYKPTKWLPSTILLSLITVFGVLATNSCHPSETQNPDPRGTTPEYTEDAQRAFSALLTASDDPSRIELAEEYLEHHADSSDFHQLIAEAQLGGAQWRASCSEPNDALCLHAESFSEDTALCGSRLGSSYRPIPRDTGLSTEALKNLERVRALSISLSPPKDPKQTELLADALGMVDSYLGDAKIEAYLTIDAPTALDWSGNGQTDQKTLQYAFGQFMTRKLEAREQLGTLYRAAEKAGSPRWQIRSARRQAMLEESLYDGLISVPLPSDNPTTEQRERASYCKAIQPHLAPLKAAALDSYKRCETIAKDHTLSSDESALCLERRRWIESANDEWGQ